MSPIRRGDVFRIRLDPGVGNEIRKTRPGVVVSNDQACRFDTVVQIVPVTGLSDRPLRRYEARLSSSGSGLTKPSRAVTNQIRTVAKNALSRESVISRIPR
jgi:mRNA interferase MazF